MSETYKYEIIKPSMQISDEEFFGVWDSQKGEWKEEGVLKYNPRLAEVEQFVKQTDYQSAKDAFLQQYIKEYGDKKITSYDFSEKATEAAFAGLERNVYTVNAMNGMSAGIFKTSDVDKWYVTDVTHTVKSVKFGSVDYISYQLVSVDKSENTAYFYSRNTNYPPYLEMAVNGNKIKVGCGKNVMLRAGEHSYENYCGKELLEVRESGCFHSHDERMKRTYFAFDISFLKETDIVESASLHVYGRSDTEGKEIFVYNEFESGWDESEFCWDNVTDELIFSCSDMNCWDYITGKNPHDKGKICFYHRGGEFGFLTQLYSKEHDEKYAYTFIRNYMSYLNYVGCNENVLNELDMGCHCHYATESVMRVINSKYMTGERFTEIAKNLYLIAGYLVNNYYGKAYNNWGTYATKGVYAVMAFFPELRTRDEWFAATINENRRLISGFIHKDGSCIELGVWYHNVVIGTITECFYITNETGVKPPFSEDTYDILRNLVKSFYYTLSPTGSDLNIGDTTRPFEDLTAKIKKWYNLSPWIYGDIPEIMYVVTDKKEGHLPDFSSVNFPDNIRFIMRSDWSKDALCMEVTGKMEGSHGHNDAYSLAMMSYGKHLLTDQGYGTQLTGNIRETMISSNNHNVVLADDAQNTQKVDAKQVACDISDKFDYYEIAGKNNEVVDIQHRSVTFCKDQRLWIVSDYIKPRNMEKETKYVQYWHMLPNADMQIENNIIRSNFQSGANVMLVTAGSGETSIESSKYSPGDGIIIPSKKAAYTKRAVGEQTFDTIVIPLKDGEQYEVKISEINVNSKFISAFEAQITDSSGKTLVYTYMHNNGKKRTVDLGRFSSDAQNLIIVEDLSGKVVSSYVYNGNFIKK